MVKRRILFDGPGASDVFDALWLGFCVGRGFAVHVDASNKGQSRDERRADRAIKVAMESVSDPAPATADKLPFFNDAQRVVRVGESIIWEQAQVDKLVNYMNRTPWSTERLDLCEMALDALGAAPEVVDAPA